MMKMRVRATACLGRDLKPGDLFSTAGPWYWAHVDSKGSVGQRVYIRTNAPADLFADADERVYRIEIERVETVEKADRAGSGPSAQRDLFDVDSLDNLDNA